MLMCILVVWVLHCLPLCPRMCVVDPPGCGVCLMNGMYRGIVWYGMRCIMVQWFIAL
jgi:hypothetical protein